MIRFLLEKRRARIRAQHTQITPAPDPYCLARGEEIMRRQEMMDCIQAQRDADDAILRIETDSMSKVMVNK